ncbi:ATP-binding protein [Rhodococcus erythropolis]|uniref:ATP-binding protein n=1 Tax=Rhodococcus TaxID=1827 RepID=UPI001AE72D39|nr:MULTISPECIES: ATP-binding protein [Rhodococcus]MBP2521032.1 hypothetical protein [Rhodococcus sp. PvP104]MBY6389505.1 ATP-binding protein [Rhodococcus erythropolis]
MNFTALHRLLGLPPQPITNEMIDAAVTAGITETAELDWKSELPPIKDLPKSDFPKDIAAMANTGGGIIVYGITETQKAATGRRDVGELTQELERALRSAAVTAITPPIFGLRIHQIGTTGNQVVAIVVDANVDGPHLIYRGEYFGAPIRNDADTVWMKERQIELMYRARFDERRNSTDALDTLYTEQVGGKDADKRAWLIAVAHPRLPASTSTRPTLEQAKTMFDAANAHGYTGGGGGLSPLGSVRRDDPRPGLRRWIARPTVELDTMSWKAAWASIHHNGAVTIAAAIGGHPGWPRDLPNDHVDSTTLELAIADFMALIRIAGEHFGTSEYEARVGIEWTGGTPLIIQTADTTGYPLTENSLPLTRYTPVTTTVRAADDDNDYLRQIRTLAEDCINQGGITFLRAISAAEPTL